MTQNDQLRQEQAAVDVRYSRLDELRRQTADRLAATRRGGPSGSPQNRSERDAFATLYEDRLAQLDGVEQRLVFGRLDMNDDETRYVGRIGLSDAEHATLLTDWRAPAAQPFYRATAAHPDGVVRRRHLVTRGRTLTGLEDDVLDLDAWEERGGAPGDGLAGEGALMAALGAARTGRMGDIVATIQAEQDAVIRGDLAGALVVQGGPGTGKTAVALHRAAYLLYAHRSTLERSGVLLVGPSRVFLRYIDQVLPSLGETGVVTATIADLVPGVEVGAVEDPAVAEIKGRPAMARVVSRAVRQRQRVPAEEVVVVLDGRTVRITPSDVADAQARARRTGRPYNEARVTFVRDMLGRLAAQYGEQLRYDLAPEDRAEVVEELRSHRDVRVALNLAWMPLTPQRLLADLWRRPDRLAAAAPELDDATRARLRRDPDAAWTDADVPLLDEAAELLGEDDQARRRDQLAETRRREEAVEYARQVLTATGGGGGLVSAELLADRFAHSGPRLTTAERAAADRSWTYGHVVVDEAQELSPMAWRMLLRRVPTRSMTIVGDVAQTSAPGLPRRWAERLDPVLKGSWRLAELTVNYRTPREVADLAALFAQDAGLPVSSLTSARSVPGAVRVARADDDALGAVVAEVRAALGELDAEAEGAGRMAVVVPEEMREQVGAALISDGLGSALTGTRGATGLEARLAVMTPTQTKGLEFDVVVVLDPERIGARSAGDLYVALTRPTRALHVVVPGALPEWLAPALPADAVTAPGSR